MGDFSDVRELPIGEQRVIAAEVLGQRLEWEPAGFAYCVCPGAGMHSQKSGRRDCRVYIDGVRPPSMACVHKSCASAVADAATALRSALGKAALEATNAEAKAGTPHGGHSRAKPGVKAKRAKRGTSSPAPSLAPGAAPPPAPPGDFASGKTSEGSVPRRRGGVLRRKSWGLGVAPQVSGAVAVDADLSDGVDDGECARGAGADALLAKAAAAVEGFCEDYGAIDVLLVPPSWADALPGKVSGVPVRAVAGLADFSCAYGEGGVE